MTKVTTLDIVKHDGEVYVKEARKAEEAKWSAIGRKVGEIRKGDIVQTYEDECGHPVGTVGVAFSSGGRYSVSVEANGNVWRHRVNLIVPVEQRFDKEA